ncbi:hypothetical protein [Nonomuraea sp. NPDC049625]|uniref:hypothetical protein n=1 Tax=Nonomuraea sp. NPDC049625 TaxID=3155775 RepID=UPI00343AB630
MAGPASCPVPPPRGIYARTAGNPFFVRELSRLLGGMGVLTHDAVTRTEAPSTVRDVVRDRMAGLDDGARDLRADIEEGFGPVASPYRVADPVVTITAFTKREPHEL